MIAARIMENDIAGRELAASRLSSITEKLSRFMALITGLILLRNINAMNGINIALASKSSMMAI